MLWNPYTALQEFLGKLLDEAFEFLQSVAMDIMEVTFRIENLSLVDNPISGAKIQSAYAFVYGAIVFLVVLKFLWKGFQVYVLWRDGDSDVSPQGMVIGACMAVLVSLAFPLLYDILVNTAIYLADGLASALVDGATPGLWQAGLENFIVRYLTGGANLALYTLLLLVIFVILYLIMWIKVVARGIEMLFLRLGVPIATIGFVDSDSGIWKSYMQLFFRQAASSIIQAVCLILGLRIIYNLQPLNILVGIAVEMAAFSVPKLMSQLLAPGGGTASSKASAATSVLYMAKLLGG